MSFSLEDYPGIYYREIENPPPLEGLKYENFKVKDVPGDFARLSVNGDYLAINDHGLIKRIRYTGRNIGGNLARTHIQGIQRLRNGTHFILSGGDFFDSTAQLFSAQVQSFTDRIKFSGSLLSNYEKGKINRGPYGSNILKTGFPFPEDRLTFITQINEPANDPNAEGGKGYWHAGGIALCGDVLVVPLEDTGQKTSLIRFFSLKKPNKPVIFEHADILRDPHKGKAGAAAFCRLKNKFFICAVWVDGKEKGNQRIDFYFSKTTKLKDGFRPNPSSWFYRDLIGLERENTTYQNLQFAIQENNDIYLIGTDNTSGMSPLVRGQNVAELMKLDFSPTLWLKENPVLLLNQISLINHKEFNWSTNYYNMDAGAGIYISSSKQLLMYGVYHWRQDGEFRFVEFAPQLSKPGHTISDVQQSRIEIYEHNNFRGRVIRLYGKAHSTIENYKNIFVQEGQFNDKASSVRFHLPQNCRYVLYEDHDFGGKQCPLQGTGHVQEIPDLKHFNNFNDKASSSRFI